jgi:hypothetical protein
VASASGSRPDRRPGWRMAVAAKHSALRLRVRLFHWGLDSSLAEGVDPASVPALAVRSAQLLSPRHRRRLAASVERLVREAERTPPPSFSVALGIARDQVVEARASLLFAGHLLRHVEPTGPRGVAILERLLTDGASVVYLPSARGALELQVQRALDCLVGADMASPEAWFSSSNAERRDPVGRP